MSDSFNDRVMLCNVCRRVCTMCVCFDALCLWPDMQRRSSGTRVEWSSAVYALLTSGPSSRVKQEVPNVDTLSC